MRSSLPLALAILLLTAAAFASKPRAHTATATHHVSAGTHHAATHTSARRGRADSSRSHGRATHEASHPVVAMDSERATQIQTALIKQGYLTGEPSGHWDAESIAAMQKLQADNGWQTKIMPDSRAIIKLGLGPGSAPPLPAATPAAPLPDTPR